MESKAAREASYKLRGFLAVSRSENKTRLVNKCRRPQFSDGFNDTSHLRRAGQQYSDKMPVDLIQYSDKYYDDKYEYRHVILPPDLARLVPKTHLLTETEWRNLGVQQSPGWVHYMLHEPEPHVLLFRRPRTDIPLVPRSAPFQAQPVFSI